MKSSLGLLPSRKVILSGLLLGRILKSLQGLLVGRIVKTLSRLLPW